MTPEELTLLKALAADLYHYVEHGLDEHFEVSPEQVEALQKIIRQVK